MVLRRIEYPWSSTKATKSVDREHPFWAQLIQYGLVRHRGQGGSNYITENSVWWRRGKPDFHDAEVISELLRKRRALGIKGEGRDRHLKFWWATQ